VSNSDEKSARRKFFFFFVFSQFSFVMSWGYAGGMGFGAHIALRAPDAVNVWQRAHVERAPTGLASCRTCKRKIGHETLRVIFGGGKFVHLRCWKGPDNASVPENYFVAASLLSHEEQAKLQAWIANHNSKQSEKAAPVPANAVRTFSVSAVKAGPQQEDGDGLGIALLTKDTFGLILRFLDVKQLCLVERVSKAFLRAATFEFQRRLQECGFEGAASTKTPKQLYLTGICAGCNLKVQEGAVFVKSLNRSVCANCCATNRKFSFVAKKYLKDYGLVEGDIKKFKIPFEKRPNPYGRNLAPMTVFLVYDLERAQEKKSSGAPAKKAKK
jgi:hypothetical protein